MPTKAPPGSLIPDPASVGIDALRETVAVQLGGDLMVMMFNVVLTLKRLRDIPAIRDSEYGAQISALVDQLEAQHSATLGRLQDVGQRIREALE